MPTPKALARVLSADLPDDVKAETFNARQAEFVRLYAETGNNGTEAARLAGYADPGRSASYLISQPHIQAAIRKRRNDLINTTLAQKALTTLAELMEPGTPAPVRLGASRTALEMAGHLGIKEAPTALENRPLGELTVSELETLIREGQDVLTNAKLISAQVIGSPSRPE